MPARSPTRATGAEAGPHRMTSAPDRLCRHWPGPPLGLARGTQSREPWLRSGSPEHGPRARLGGNRRRDPSASGTRAVPLRRCTSPGARSTPLRRCGFPVGERSFGIERRCGCQVATLVESSETAGECVTPRDSPARGVARGLNHGARERVAGAERSGRTTGRPSGRSAAMRRRRSGARVHAVSAKDLEGERSPGRIGRLPSGNGRAGVTDSPAEESLEAVETARGQRPR